MARIAICAPSTPFTRDDADRVLALASAEFPRHELVFHEQCFAVEGHFAGSDALRLSALLECANDPAFDAVWFVRGGYGANRIAAQAVASMNTAARGKSYCGYSDAGYLLAALYRAEIGVVAHGPMPVDIRRDGGDVAVGRTLAWFDDYMAGLEPSLDPWGDDGGAVAFNLMTLAMLVGTELMPDLSNHVVLVEEVSEHLYAIDRLLFHVTHHLAGAGIAGLRLGRISDVPENDRAFGSEPTDMARFWCERTGIAYLGRADIGHDAANKIVPFGVASATLRP